MNPLIETLKKQVDSQKDLESKIEELRRFKKSHTEPLKSSFLSKRVHLEELMKKLTQVADAVIIEAYRMAVENLRPIYGMPRIKDNDGNFLSGEFAIVGMGKVGAEELHFGSDLDVIFIFNKTGKTHGAKEISNREYFAKVTQRIINYLTLHTREGYAYKVDTELRPSGNAGTLVSGLDPWVTYYHENAQTWEKQALLKARLIFASGDFAQSFQGLFHRLIFLTPFPDQLGDEIHHLRNRMETELAQETPRRWHFKKGRGGITDIEFLVQFLQLKYGKVFDDILKRDTLGALHALRGHQFLNAEEIKTLEHAYKFYRNLEIDLELKHQMSDGYLDPEQDILAEVAQEMGAGSKQEFLDQFQSYRDQVRQIYLAGLKISGET